MVLNWMSTVLQPLVVSGLKVLFKPSLPVHSLWNRCRRPSCHWNSLIPLSMSTATILHSLSLSGLKTLFKGLLPVDPPLYRCIRSSCSHRSHVYRSTEVGLRYWLLPMVFPLSPGGRWSHLQTLQTLLFPFRLSIPLRCPGIPKRMEQLNFKFATPWLSSKAYIVIDNQIKFPSDVAVVKMQALNFCMILSN